MATFSTDDVDVNKHEKIRLNVGGTFFLTTYATLSNLHNNSSPTYFHGIVSDRFKKEHDKQLSEDYYFIDRDPTHFRYICIEILRLSSIPRVSEPEAVSESQRAA